MKATSSVPVTNSGSAISPSEITEIAWSTGRSRRIPDQMPSASETGRSTISASEREHERVAGARRDERGDRRLRGDRRAEIAARHVRDPAPVLLVQRLVEPELLAVDLLLRRRCAAAEDRARGVAGQHLRCPEDEHRDERQQEHADRQPAKGEPYERVGPPPGERAGGDRGHAGRLRRSTRPPIYEANQ